MSEGFPSAPYPTDPYANSRPPSALPRLLLVLAVLLGLYLLPAFIENIQYALVHGRERAESEIARGELTEHKLDDMAHAFNLVAKSIGPSVVHIDTVSVVDRESADDEWSSDGLHGRVAQGQGSGVIVDKDGYILTNYHVIEGAREIQVKLSDGRVKVARVIGADPLTDLAVLKINADNLIAAPWGDSDKLLVGSPVFAVGNPYGLDRSITFGIVSAKSRRGFGGSNPYQDFLQTDAAVNPGNSGGPLVNINGEVVGINTAIIGKAYQGISFSIPSDAARDVYERLRETGKVARGWLGVELTELTPELAKKLNVKQSTGAVIRGVVPKSPADNAGIQPADVVIEWNGQPVDNPTTLRLLVAKTPIRSKVKAVVLRDGQKQTVEVLVEERPLR